MFETMPPVEGMKVLYLRPLSTGFKYSVQGAGAVVSGRT